MRILLITDNHTPTGGAEKVFFELKSRLTAQTNCQVFSIGFAQKASKSNDSLVLQPTTTPWSKLWWQIFTHQKTYAQLKEAINQFKPDIIHLHNIKQHTAAITKAIKGYHTVQTLHDYSAVCPTAHNIHRNLQPCNTGFRWQCALKHRHKHSMVVYSGMVFAFLLQRHRARKYTKHFIAVSPKLAEFAQKHYSCPVTFIPPFTETSVTYTPTHENSCHFLYAGHLGSHKGLHLLFTEFALALQQNKNLRLTIAGDGKEKTKLMSLVTKLKLTTQVNFIGWQTSLESQYQSHVATIVPSLWMEAFGLIITESMAHRKPVIGSNRGSIPWLIDDHQTGLIFDPLTPGDLAQKILYLASHPEEAIAMGQAGRAKLDQMIDNEATLAQTMTVYREVILKHQPQATQAPEAAV